MNKKFLATILAFTMTFGTLAAPVGESILTDNAVSVSAAKSVSETDRMRSAYRKILKNAIDNPDINPTQNYTTEKCPFNEYTIHDMDKNGVPELIIRFESCNADQYMKIYSYNTKTHKAYLLKNVSTYGSLAMDSKTGDILSEIFHDSNDYITKVHLKNNKITVKNKIIIGFDYEKNLEIPSDIYYANLRSFANPVYIPTVSGANDSYNLRYGQKKIDESENFTLAKYAHLKKINSVFYLIDKSKITTKKSSSKVTLSKQKITKVKSGKNYMKVAWKKNTKANGYQLKLASNKKFKGGKVVKITNNKTTAKTIKKLKSNKKYYAKVRSYKKIGKKVYYGKWSAVKTVKTKPSKSVQTFSAMQLMDMTYSDIYKKIGNNYREITRGEGELKGTGITSDKYFPNIIIPCSDKNSTEKLHKIIILKNGLVARKNGLSVKIGMSYEQTKKVFTNMGRIGNNGSLDYMQSNEDFGPSCNATYNSKYISFVFSNDTKSPLKYTYYDSSYIPVGEDAKTKKTIYAKIIAQ